MKTYQKFVKNYNVDVTKVFIYGFSGQGVQALMEMFLHPTAFKGVATVCAHTGTMSLAKWKTLQNHLAYLVTRTKDWNLQQNYLIHQAFQNHGVKDTLVITPGEHGIGDKYEVFRAVRWLRKNSQPK
jgi:poly(3-hydroxybutyrate) depolymerase